MKKVRLFVNRDMTVIDLGQSDCYANFHSFDYYAIIANVTNIVDKPDGGKDIHTDFKNPYRSTCSVFNLDAENFAKVRWVK